MKPGKPKKSAAEPPASAPAAIAALPDAAYVDQLLDGQSDTAGSAAAATASGVIELPAQCLLPDAVEDRQRFLDLIDADSVTVDVGAVDRIDTAFIQVLLAVARTRAIAKRVITWQRVS